MQITRKSTVLALCSRGVATLLVGLAVSAPIEAQIQAGSLGNNVVYKGPGMMVAGSSAVIDASVFPGADVCAKINAVLTSTSPAFPARGAVIDARGIFNPVSLLTCLSGTPWQGTPPANGWPPATILLPPGGITIQTPWVLPNGTRIIGERRNTTTLFAAPSFPAGETMIQMGSSDNAVCPLLAGVHVCKGVGIQYVSLDGEERNPPTGAPVNGIDNEYSQDLSYVDHVDFRFLEGTGLKVGAGATNSGPYSNLIFAAGGGSKGETTQTACVVFQASTRGLHGITCTANGTPLGAVHLQASNNSVEDIHVEGFVDGVVVGDSAASGSKVAGNVLMSIDGGFGGNTGAVRNVIHICNPANPATGTACSAGNWSVSDLTVLGVSADHAVHFHSPIAIQDDVSDGTLHTSQAAATDVALYVLGEPFTIGSDTGFSRFSSTFSADTGQPIVPTWGAGVLGTVSLPTPCPTGSIFSNTNSIAGSNNTLYVCVGGTNWEPVITANIAQH
jgi:hypothetical protein